MSKKITNQAQATLEIAKGLFAVAEALKSLGATVPPAQPTPPMANGLDGAIVEVAKGVHQVAKGVESLPQNTASSVVLNEQGQFVYRQEERIQFRLDTADYFEREHSYQISSKLRSTRYPFARRLRVVGENADAVSPQVLDLDEHGNEIYHRHHQHFFLTRYVPEITIVMEMPLDLTPQVLESDNAIWLADRNDDYPVDE